MTEAGNSCPIILIGSGCADNGFNFPCEKDNLFDRIIKNPLQRDQEVREVRCTELLCVMLRTLPKFRKVFCSFLIDKTTLSRDLIDDLSWDFETERQAFSKRIDLLITGKKRNSDIAEILWSVEIKVNASFHFSSRFAEEEVVEVNQIVNYDDWLNLETANNKHGFVISKNDLSNDISEKLNHNWYFIKWSDLGREILSKFEEGFFPQEEIYPIKHYLGFIYTYLARRYEMKKNGLGFDNIALLRAHDQIGSETKDILSDFIKNIKAVVENSKLNSQKIKVYDEYYIKEQQCWVSATLLEKMKFFVKFYAVFHESHFYVGIESVPSSKKKKFQDALKNKLSKFSINNRYWTCSSEEGEWTDIEIGFSLTELLNVDDQGQTLAEWTSEAIDHLIQIDIFNIINDVYKEEISK